MRTLFAPLGHQVDHKATYYPPPGDDFDPRWAETWYEEQGGKKYCLLDPTTKAGRAEVARYNGLSENWLEVTGDNEANFDAKKTPICKRLYALALLYAKNGNFKHVAISPWEGMHRLTASIQVLFGGTVDDKGVISPGTLTFKQFGEYLQSEDHPNEDLQAVIEAFLSKSKKSDMLENDIDAEVSYLNNTNSAAKDFCSHARILSKAVSNNKRDSATVGPFQKAAQLISSEISPDSGSFICRPECSHLIVPQTKGSYVNESATFKAYKNANGDENIAFPACEVLDTNEMKKYIKSPFDKKNRNAARSLLSFEPKKDSSTIKESNGNTNNVPTLLYPPFGVPLKSITEDFGNKKKEESPMTTEVANQYYFIPPIMAILYAGIKNVQESEVANNAELTALTTFYLKYLVNSKDDVTSVELHRAYQVVYKKPYPVLPYIIQRPLHILGAAQLIVGMINVVLACACDDPEDSSEDRKRAVTNAVRDIVSALESVQTKTLGTETDDALYEMGKFFCCIPNECRFISILS